MGIIIYYNKHHDIRIPIQQPVFHGKYPGPAGFSLRAKTPGLSVKNHKVAPPELESTVPGTLKVGSRVSWIWGGRFDQPDPIIPR